MRLLRFLLIGTLFVLPFGVSAAPNLYDTFEGTRLTMRAVPLEVGPVLRGAQRVPFLSIALAANCVGDVTVREIHVHQRGLGDPAGITGVYLLRGYQRLSRSTSISNDQIATLRPLKLVIPACETWRIEVAANFSATADIGSAYWFEVPSPADILTDAALLDGSFPLRNPLGSEVTPLSAGTLTVTFLSLPSKIRTVVEETLAKFQVEADKESHHLLQAITFTNDGTAKDDEVRNMYVTRSSGRALTGTAYRLDGKSVTLKFFEPYFIRKGQAVNFELKGRSYKSTETIRFIVKEPADMQAQSVRKAGRTLR